MSVVSTRTVNGTPTPTLWGGIETRTVRHYCVDGRKIVEEHKPGRYSVSATECSYLDLPAVRRLHAVLGKILEEADPDPREMQPEHDDDTEPAPF